MGLFAGFTSGEVGVSNTADNTVGIDDTSFRVGRFVVAGFASGAGIAVEGVGLAVGDDGVGYAFFGGRVDVFVGSAGGAMIAVSYESLTSAVGDFLALFGGVEVEV